MPSAMPSSFSPQRARGLRNGAGLSQHDLAARLGCSVEAVDDWERGRSVPSPETLAALADALGTTPDVLDRVHDDPIREYVSGVLHDAPPLPQDALEAAARVLRRMPRSRPSSSS